MNNTRNNLFDFIKFVMISFVIITHINWPSEARESFVFHYFVNMAVPIFLLISSYLRTSKSKKYGLIKAYGIKEIIKTLLGILVAYFIVVIIEVLALLMIYKSENVGDMKIFSSFTSIIIWIITGTTGKGSYYVPLLLQFIVYFPILYVTFEKNKYVGLLSTFIINLLYDLMVYYFCLEAALYRLLIFRYTFILGLGIFLFLSKEHKKVDDISAIIMLFLGYVYINNQNCLPLFQGWKSTSMLCGPYAYGLMYFIIKYFFNLKYNYLCELGKASYHIYLTQMVYYTFGNPIISKLVGTNNIFLLVLINLIICLSFGYLFYLIEMPIRKKLLKLIDC